MDVNFLTPREGIALGITFNDWKNKNNLKINPDTNGNGNPFDDDDDEEVSALYFNAVDLALGRSMHGKTSLATSTVLILVSRRARKKLFSISDLRVATWAITTASLLMTTGATLWIWQVIPQLSYLQFPSRWLAITTAGISLIAAVAAAEITAIRRFRVPCAIALGAAVALNLTIGVMEVQRAPFCEEPVDPTVLRREVPEYRPKWWDNKLHDDVNLSPVVVSNGSAAVTVLDDAGINQSYTVNAVSESTLTLRTLYFPGWVARVDGVPKQIQPSSEGRIQLTIDPGEHNIALAFEDTWPRTTGKYGFATCTLTALGLMFSRSRFRSGKSLTPSGEGNQHDPA
jgi:hypothetical protein